MAYNKRGWSKYMLEDYYAAIADFSKAIEMDSSNPWAYRNRGLAKENLGDMKGACADWRMAYSFGQEDASQWVRNQC